MNPAEEVESAAAAEHHDDRLARAFDRAARLGIDLDAGDSLSERESAAVRAFTALDLTSTRDDAYARDPAGGDDEPVEPPLVDDGPLRPDAVWHGGPFVRHGAPAGVPAPVEAAQVVDVPPVADTDNTAATAGIAGATSITRDHTADATSLPRDHTADATSLTRDHTADATSLTRDHTADATSIAGAVGMAEVAVAAEAVPPARAIDRYLLAGLALAVATGAFVSPWVWLSVVTVAALGGATARSIAVHGSQPVALLRRAARRALSWLRPRSAIRLTTIATRTVLLAVAVPGLACAVWWVVDQGTDGAFVAGRVGVWAHGLRTAAAIVCFMLVAGVGEAHQRRAAQVGRAASRVGTTGAVTLALAAAVVAVLVVAVVPRLEAGRLAGADGLGWAPGRLRDNIDRVRDDLVAAELHAAAGCLSDRQGVTWHVTYTAGNPLGDVDVARLTVREGMLVPHQMATAAAAVHNQLAPWVESIELGIGAATLVALDRGALGPDRPLVDPAAMIDAASAGSDLLADGTDGFDRAVALSCSAAPLP